MPVILELDDYEVDLVVDALMEGRRKLMKDWGARLRSPERSPFEDDLALIDSNIVAVAALRERLREGIMWQRFCQERSIDPTKRVSVAWHREHGWRPSSLTGMPSRRNKRSPGRPPALWPSRPTISETLLVRRA